VARIRIATGLLTANPAAALDRDVRDVVWRSAEQLRQRTKPKPTYGERFLRPVSVTAIRRRESLSHIHGTIVSMRRRVNRADLERDPHAVWNSFVHLLACIAYGELDDAQRPAYLVFCYESEIQNGGHLQFFENRPAELIEPTLDALRALGGEIYVPILCEAVDRWRSRQRDKLETKEAFVSEALDGEFDDFDKACYATQPTMIQLLENYLESRRADFVILES